MRQVYEMPQRCEIKVETVGNDEKPFSIYEQHADIMVKGSREIRFGHKINLASGRSSMMAGCEVLSGNPPDSSPFQPVTDRVMDNCGTVPRDGITDGGHASRENMKYARDKVIANIVFNKTVGSLKNTVSGKNMETRLKKWRSGMEAVISNFKRGYDMFRCYWKGKEHFAQKVFWSVIAYHIRVMTAKVLKLI
ncbi:hypothetical protein EZS27_020685 [termite gut metagenome]|uniref:Transposase IS4-like domain-containing protein n=1 Tax=termite gut metagenome TaxID=433724 RepID=A0A5J4RC03_9ZZZZ